MIRRPPRSTRSSSSAASDVYKRQVPVGTVRYNRLQTYDAFVARWPDLRDWFAAPLPMRAVDRQDARRGQNPHGAHVLMPYLVYLSLVQGVPLDYELLLVRTFRTCLLYTSPSPRDS